MESLWEACEKAVVLMAWIVFIFAYVMQLRAGLNDEVVIFSDGMDLLTSASTLVLAIAIFLILLAGPYDDPADTLFYTWLLLPICSLAVLHQAGQELLTCFTHATSPFQAVLTFIFRYIFLITALLALMWIFSDKNNQTRASSISILIKFGLAAMIAYLVRRLVNADRVYRLSSRQRKDVPKLLTWVGEKLACHMD